MGLMAAGQMIGRCRGKKGGVGEDRTGQLRSTHTEYYVGERAESVLEQADLCGPLLLRIRCAKAHLPWLGLARPDFALCATGDVCSMRCKRSEVLFAA